MTSDYAVLLIMVLVVLALLLFVRKSSVEQKAFDNAKTLIEVCGRIRPET